MGGEVRPSKGFRVGGWGWEGGHEGNDKRHEHLVSNTMPFTQETDSKAQLQQ